MVSLLMERTYQVTRRAPGSYVDGHWVKGAPTVTPVICSCRQPINGRERQVLEEGKRVRATHKLYTEGDIQVDDEVEVNGESHIVVATETYETVIPHTEVFLTKELES